MEPLNSVEKAKAAFDEFWAQEIDAMVLNPDIRQAFYLAWMTGYLAGMESVGPIIDSMDERVKNLLEVCEKFKILAEKSVRAAKENKKG